MNFDVVVIGGGPGGYVSAIRASKLGLKTAIIDYGSECFGGTCLTKGCIPTKALLQAAKVKNTIDNSENFGIASKAENIDFEKIINRGHEIISCLNSGVVGLLNNNNVQIITGAASFVDKNTLAVTGTNDRITAKNIVIATGAIPKIPANIHKNLFDAGLAWTSKEAMFSKNPPSSVLILGSGAIGIEFASFFNSFGIEVTVAEIMDRILIAEDEEVSAYALKAFKKRGINFHLKTAVKDFKNDGGKLSVDINGSRKIFDVCVVAIGVVPNVGGLNIDSIGIKQNTNGSIIVDETMMTSVDGIYAIGDVANTPWLAHKASREGMICAESIAGIKNILQLNYNMIPSCIYSSPQIASVGITEKMADVTNVKVGKSYFRNNGKAMAVGDNDGFVKVIFNGDTGELLGAHMIGYEVTELIPVFSLAMSSELTEKEIMNTVFPHPTMSECLQEAVMNAFNAGVH